MTERLLYLLPVSINQSMTDGPFPFLPPSLAEKLTIIFAEDIRSTRRFLRKTGYSGDLDAKNWIAVNRDTSLEMVLEGLKMITPDTPGGIISESGIPTIADPGADIVALAHQSGIRVIPLPGPSSIFLALAASGMNGQQFSFHGYLPIRDNERERKVKSLEAIALQSQYTQIFMETPYRNLALLKSILKVCRDDTQLCIAADITGPGEFIKTQSIVNWKKSTPQIHKKPAIFLLNS